MPDTGYFNTTIHNFDINEIKCIPLLTSNSGMTVSDLWDHIAGIGENLGLSERGFKYLIMSRLRGEFLTAWQFYKDFPLREAIQSLAAHFDNPTSSHEFSNQIHTFKRHKTESIRNAIQRLSLLFSKAHPTLDENEKNILKRAVLKEKLPTMMSSQVFRRVRRRIDREKEKGIKLNIQNIVDLAEMEENYENRHSHQAQESLNFIEHNQQTYQRHNQYEDLIPQEQETFSEDSFENTFDEENAYAEEQQHQEHYQDQYAENEHQELENYQNDMNEINFIQEDFGCFSILSYY